MADNLKGKVVRGTFWVLLEKSSCQIVTFVVGMVLARLLTPEDFGTVALTGIFFAVADVLVDGGFGSALIQKKDSDDIDFNSVFYLNLGLSLLVYAALFLSAPRIAGFYRTPVLTPIVRVSALVLVFNAFNAIQGAALTKRMLFHLGFRISLIAAVASAACGVTLALGGYGVWALVWSALLAAFVRALASWAIVAWRPRLLFSWARLRPLFAFGWKMSVANLLDRFFVNLKGLLIGRVYSRADLAYVDRGTGMPQLAMDQINSSLNTVSFPALVTLQRDPHALREAMRRMMRCSTFLVFPLMVFMAVCARSELLLFYGDQWVPATPYLRLACFAFALWPFHTINLKGLEALGRSDIFLVLEILKKTAALLVILGFFRYGVFVFMAVYAFALGPLSVVINAWPNRKLLRYSVVMQIRDVLPTVAICAAEAALLVGTEFAYRHWILSDAPVALAGLLLLQLVCGFAGYFACACLFRLKPLVEFFRIASPALTHFSPNLERCLGTWLLGKEAAA